MPEGAECRIIADQLAAAVVSRRVNAVEIGLDSRYRDVLPTGFEEFQADLDDNGSNRVTRVSCKGKLIYWELERDEWSVWNTLGMSGAWSHEPTKHEVARFDLTNGKQLFFNDARHFGTVKFVRGRRQLQKKLASLGHDPLVDPPTNDQMYQLLTNAKDKQVAQLLMDQRKFAGVGNYVKSEACYAAGISPKRPCGDVTHQEAIKLRDAIVDVMRKSYESGGATIVTYSDVNGNMGRYSDKFAVYGKRSDPHGNVVVREVTLDKRASWHVPNVQT